MRNSTTKKPTLVLVITWESKSALSSCFDRDLTSESRVLGHSVGAKDGEAWHRMRSCVDPHFSLDHAFELLPVMISDTEEWMEQLPSLPISEKDEKGRLHIKAEKLVSELPFKMIARRLFGELIDEKVCLPCAARCNDLNVVFSLVPNCTL